MITSGFIDTHIHGCFGEDTSDASPEGIVKMARELRKIGVSAFTPTTMTIPFDQIERCFEAVLKAKEILAGSHEPYARILGIHLEGPFLNPTRAGVQAESACVAPADGIRFNEALESNYPGLLKIIDIAPELKGGMEYIEHFKDKYVLSLAHTDADYVTACRAFESGAKSVTHLLNAMNGCDKRAPGILGAVFDNPDVYTEIICDGIHIEPTVLRMLFTILRDDRTIIVSDAMRGAGMPDGEYLLGPAKVQKRDGRTYFGPQGGLAGSVTTVPEMAVRLDSFGINSEAILISSSRNALERLSLDFDAVSGCSVRLARDLSVEDVYEDGKSMVKML